MNDLLDKVAPAVRITSSDIRTMLRAKFPAEEYALLFEVPNGTGSHANRSADAIAVSLWPSRGLVVNGFEIKVSRQDWVRELANPKKADDIAKFCDRWSLVVSEEKIVHPGELPDAWGLFVVKGDKLKCVKEPAKLEPIPLNRIFVAAMCRAAQKASPAKAEIDAAVKAARAEEKEMWDRVGRQSREHERHTLDTLRKSIADFEAASGIQIGNWNGGKVGEAVKLVMSGGLDRQAKTIRSVLQEVGALHDGLKALNALLPKEEF